MRTNSGTLFFVCAPGEREKKKLDTLAIFSLWLCGLNEIELIYIHVKLARQLPSPWRCFRCVTGRCLLTCAVCSGRCKKWGSLRQALNLTWLSGCGTLLAVVAGSKWESRIAQAHRVFKCVWLLWGRDTKGGRGGVGLGTFSTTPRTTVNTVVYKKFLGAAQFAVFLLLHVCLYSRHCDLCQSLEKIWSHLTHFDHC